MNAPAPAAQLTQAEPALELIPRSAIEPSTTRIQAARRARFDAVALQDLADSIRACGLLQPLLVRPHPQPTAHRRYELVAGERRWRAAHLADLALVPAIVRPLTDLQVLEAQLVENLQREGLGPLEEAEGYRELMALRSLTPEQLGEQIGKSRRWVYSRLKLLELGHEAREALAQGKLDASRALIVARTRAPKLQAKALKLATARTWDDSDLLYSVRQLAEHLERANLTQPLARAPFALGDATYFRFVPVPGRRGQEDAEPCPACVDCPSRSGNCDPEATDANVCTDVPCYESKVEQHGERRKRDLRAAGRPVVAGDEAKALLPDRHTVVGHMDLDDDDHDFLDTSHVPEQIDGESAADFDRREKAYFDRPPVTLRAALAQALADGRIQPVVVEDPRDKSLRELVPVNAAAKLLKQQGIEVPQWVARRTAQDAPPHDPEQAKRQAEAQRERQEQETTYRRALLAAVFAKASGPLTRAELVEIAQTALDDCDRNELDTLYGGKIPTPGIAKDTELGRLIRIAGVLQCVETYASPAKLLALAKRVKVDPAKVKAQLRDAGKPKGKKK